MKHTIKVLLFITFGLGSVAIADVEVGDNLKMKGDFRFRVENDSRDNSGVTQKRLRPRLRARLGVKYKASDKWTLGLRLRTAPLVRSPHKTMGGLDSANSNTTVADSDTPANTHKDTTPGTADFGLDRAFVKRTLGDKAGFVWIGRNALPVWQQSEVFWDEDLQVEGVAVNYKWSQIGLTAQGSYTIIKNNNWQLAPSNDAMTTMQLLYQKGIGSNMNITAAYTMAHLGDGDPVHANGGSQDFSLASLQFKTKAVAKGLQIGIDMLKSSADTVSRVLGGTDHNDGMVIHVRAKLTDKIGVRFYTYNVDEQAVPFVIDNNGNAHSFGQDNLPSSSNDGAVGFDGQRIQVDYKVAKNIAIDLRHYITKKKTDNDAGFIGENKDITRTQLNFNIKF